MNDTKPFNVEDRIEALKAKWPCGIDPRLLRDIRKHFGDLRPGLTPEQIETEVERFKRERGNIGGAYEMNYIEGYREALTRYGVQPQADEVCLGSFASQGVGALKYRAESAERDLAVARERIAELEAGIVDALPATLNALTWGEKTIIAQHRRIAELESKGGTT